MKPAILIITGYGANCEAESRVAWEQAGAVPRLVHLNDLLARPALLRACQALMLIGGFSFGDHMGSGHALALRLRLRWREHLQALLDRGGLMLGICNGFQVMVKIGLLPGLDGEYFTPRLALMPNDCGVFQNFWVRVAFDPRSPCVFTRGLPPMDLPIRHGEGKLCVIDRALQRRLEDFRLAACRYVDPASGRPTMDFPHNPNGSWRAIAGVCDPTGRIFGMMPHPEAYLFPENHPRWQAQRLAGALPAEGAGLQIFRRAVQYWR